MLFILCDTDSLLKAPRTVPHAKKWRYIRYPLYSGSSPLKHPAVPWETMGRPPANRSNAYEFAVVKKLWQERMHHGQVRSDGQKLTKKSS